MSDFSLPSASSRWSCSRRESPDDGTSTDDNELPSRPRRRKRRHHHNLNRLPSRCPASLIPKVGLGLKLVLSSPYHLVRNLCRLLSRWLSHRFQHILNDIYIPSTLTTNYPLATDELSRLWTSSRLVFNKDSKKWEDEYRRRGPGGGRITKRYLAICYRIQQLTFIRTLKLMCQGNEWLMFMDLVINVSRGLSGPAGIWLFEKLVDEAHSGFNGRIVDSKRLLWLTAASAGLEVIETLVARLQLYINNQQKAHSRLTIDAALIEVEFSLQTNAQQNPWTQDILNRARDLAFDRTFINNIDPLIRESIGILGQLYILYSVTLSLKKVLPPLYVSTLILIPTTISYICSAAVKLSEPVWRENKNNTELRYVRMLPDMGDEFSLYGLKDWALREWKKLSIKNQGNEDEDQAVPQSVLLSSTFSVVQSLQKSSTYIIPALTSAIATGPISFGLALTAAQAGPSLLTSISTIQRTTNQILMATTTQAAFWASIDASKVDRWNQRQGWYWIGKNDQVRPVNYEDIRDKKGGVKIDIKGLEFTFQGASKPTLHGIDLSLKPGETLAIVGVNGGGKTTLAKVIMGMYDYQQGTYTLNGTPTSQITVQSFHNRTASLLQDFVEYPYSIRKTVGFGDVDRMNDKAALKDAIFQGGAEELLKKMGWHSRFDPYSDLASDSEGSDSDLEDEDLVPPGEFSGSNANEEEGKVESVIEVSATGRKRRKRTRVDPSGGQWQRLALARTFFRSRKSDLIVYDEPSSALDPRAEYELFKRIRALSKERRTTIYISHRFSTVRKADKIAVMEGGTIIEMGSHEELMRLKGHYCEMFTLQKEGFDGG